MTRLVGLKHLQPYPEPLLEGLLERIYLIILLFKKIGEFPLVEGSFKNLIRTNLPFEIHGSLNFISQTSFTSSNCFLIFIDHREVQELKRRNKQELKQRSNYGYLNKFN